MEPSQWNQTEPMGLLSGVRKTYKTPQKRKKNIEAELQCLNDFYFKHQHFKHRSGAMFEFWWLSIACSIISIQTSATKVWHRCLIVRPSAFTHWQQIFGADVWLFKFNHRHSNNGIQTMAANLWTGFADEYVRLYAPLSMYLHISAFLLFFDAVQSRLDSNIESKSSNNTYLNIIQILFLF